MPEVLGFRHERVVIEQGRRSELPVLAAIHSTRLGSAVGGTRMWTYPDWRDGLSDVLRLSEAMSLKNAAAGLDRGGGKAVIALPPNTELTSALREDVMRDLGDLIESLGGSLIVGEDVGTTAQDMLIVREQTRWAAGLPADAGGSGEPAEPTAVGVYAAIEASAQQVFGTRDLTGRRACVLGLGQVGARLARRLAAAGVALTVTDVVADKRTLGDELGATSVEPEQALFVETDLLIPAALGGILRPDTVPRLRCACVVGPANNQLADDSVASLLAERGILWAPDFIANAGGVVFGVALSLDGKSPEDALVGVEAIGERLASVFERALERGVPPLTIAVEDAQARIAAADASTAGARG